MDTDRFIVYIKTADIHKDIAKDFEAKFLIIQIMNQIENYQEEKMKK